MCLDFKGKSHKGFTFSLSNQIAQNKPTLYRWVCCVLWEDYLSSELIEECGYTHQLLDLSKALYKKKTYLSVWLSTCIHKHAPSEVKVGYSISLWNTQKHSDKMISLSPFLWLSFIERGLRSHANTVEDVYQRVAMKRNNSRAESLLIL